MNIAIVGAEAAKFSPEWELEAKRVIRNILAPTSAVLVSGRSPLGGIDVWAEEIADELRLGKLIYPPKTRRWRDGYRPRNILIADNCHVLYNITVARYIDSFCGRKFSKCYHCEGLDIVPHVKSGGCWTAHRARGQGKKVSWLVIGTPINTEEWRGMYGSL